MNMNLAVGRVIHLFLAHDGGHAPRAAIIAGVNKDGTVNLACFDHDGRSFSKQNVVIVFDGDMTPSGSYVQCQGTAPAKPGVSIVSIDTGAIRGVISELRSDAKDASSDALAQAFFDSRADSLAKAIGDKLDKE